MTRLRFCCRKTGANVCLDYLGNYRTASSGEQLGLLGLDCRSWDYRPELICTAAIGSQESKMNSEDPPSVRAESKRERRGTAAFASRRPGCAPHGGAAPASVCLSRYSRSGRYHGKRGK